jgi:hypothetical protein
MKTGSEIGLIREATVIQYNKNGTMDVALNEAGAQETKKKFTVNLKIDWAGINGQLAAGFPAVGSTVSVVQGHGGKWYVDNYLPPNGMFQTTSNAFSISSNTNSFANFKLGRYLIQTENENCFYLDSDVGIYAGGTDNFWQLNSKKNVALLYSKQQYEFSEAHTKITGIVKRDKVSNFNRNLTSSSLYGLDYENNLQPIGIDPITKTNYLTSGNLIRNIPLTEERKIYYELASSYQYDNDQLEVENYNEKKSFQEKINNDRRKNRSISLNLHDQNPNSLLEIIYGTVVDSHGNILDLNYSILPSGRRDDLNLSTNQKKSDTFLNLRQTLSQSIAFHFELNSRHYNDNFFSIHKSLL